MGHSFFEGEDRGSSDFGPPIAYSVVPVMW